MGVQRLVFLLVVMGATAALAAGSAKPSTGAADVSASRMPMLSLGGADAIDAMHWAEAVFTASTRESVDVSVSTSYPAGEPIGQHWADFFALLPHGAELARLKVYVAPLGQVQEICGGSAVGCYGDDRLVVTNESALGFAPEEIARHEYGHHVALNRSNAPWPAFDWGPKHWATAADVCRRAHSSTAYPGDESLLYRLNPGEAFAEAYRVLVDTKLGATPTWPLVDASFYPDRAVLDAVEKDVLLPWSGPGVRVLHVRIPHGDRAWAQRLATPLDGTFRVTLPRGLRAVVSVVGDDDRPLRRTDLFPRRPTPLDFEICGQRSVTVRVTAPTRRDLSFGLRVSVP